MRVPEAYRRLLARPQTRLLLAGLGVSSLGDGISTVTIAWLAVRTAPDRSCSGSSSDWRSPPTRCPGSSAPCCSEASFADARRAPSSSRTAFCAPVASALIAVLAVIGALTPPAYLVLLAASSLMAAWGNAGEYTMLSALAGPSGRFAVNSLASAQASFAFIIGPVVAGVLLATISPGWLLLLDAVSFAVLGVAAWLTRTDAGATDNPVDLQAAESGFRLLRRRDLLGLTVVTWVFFFLYGPVEVALPVTWPTTSGPRRSCSRPTGPRSGSARWPRTL